jgi:hypothetical protein
MTGGLWRLRCSDRSVSVANMYAIDWSYSIAYYWSRRISAVPEDVGKLRTYVC